MGWWGKLVGGAFGFMLGGPLGALLGAALGHQFDRGLDVVARGGGGGPYFNARERTQTAFFTAAFSVMGHLAKADGRVTHDELRIATAVMDRMGLSPDLRRVAQRLFQEGKATDFPLDEVLDQFLQECHRDRNLIRVFVEIQLHAAYADERMHPEEARVLRYVCRRLGVPRAEFEWLESLVRAAWQFRQPGAAGAGGAQAPLEDAYAVLNVAPDASDEEVKRAYRRLMSQHHPDKLVSRGLPEEMMKMATEKSQEITSAYDRVRQARGM